MTGLIDSHCHLDWSDYSGKVDEVIARMQAAGVTRALCISVNMGSFVAIRQLAEQYDCLWTSVGVHPDQRPEEPGVSVSVEQLTALADHPKVVGIGETGLDYHWIKEDAAWQRERFRVHVRAARAAAKPLIIHTREAAEDTLAIMREEGADAVGGVMHCFTESLEVAQAAMSMNFHISFSGIVTFKNAEALRAVVRDVPLDRMLVETDAPFLAPMPHRGKTNEPAFVRHVAEKIAQIKDISVDEVARATTENFLRLFGQRAGAH